TESSRPFKVASPIPVTPSAVVILSVTKLRPGQVTMTRASTIREPLRRDGISSVCDEVMPQRYSVRVRRDRLTSRMDEWCIDEMFSQEPGLQLAGADHVGDQEVIRPVVTQLSHLRCRLVRLDQDRLVRFQQPRQH